MCDADSQLISWAIEEDGDSRFTMTTEDDKGSEESYPIAGFLLLTSVDPGEWTIAGGGLSAEEEAKILAEYIYDEGLQARVFELLTILMSPEETDDDDGAGEPDEPDHGCFVVE
jgi:hypothetical protein